MLRFGCLGLMGLAVIFVLGSGLLAIAPVALPLLIVGFLIVPLMKESKV